MTATMRAFRALTPITLRVGKTAYAALLDGPFGEKNDWEMDARRAVVEAGPGGIAHLHPDACVALRIAAQSAQWLSHDKDIAGLDVLIKGATRAVVMYRNHPWFLGRSLSGPKQGRPSLPAWEGDGILNATRGVATVPVILHPVGAKVASRNVTKFTIEEVQWP